MILQNKNGQYFLTVPKNLAEGMGWKAGDVLTFKIAGKDRLELVKA